MTDQQRWDTLSYTGRTACRTPNLDRLAQEGTAFDRCLTADPICCPSRAAVFTRRFPHATGVGNNYELPLERPTLPEVFRDAGYHVAYSGKWHLGRGRGAAALAGRAQFPRHLSLRHAGVLVSDSGRRGQPGDPAASDLHATHCRPGGADRVDLRRLGSGTGARKSGNAAKGSALLPRLLVPRAASDLRHSRALLLALRSRRGAGAGQLCRSENRTNTSGTATTATRSTTPGPIPAS